jgi:hypothetical protein
MAAAGIAEGKKPTGADATREQLEQAAQCFGATTAILNLLPFLAPEYAPCVGNRRITQAQVILVIASYLRDHPENLDQNFFISALLALRSAWPCPGDAGK